MREAARHLDRSKEELAAALGYRDDFEWVDCASELAERAPQSP